MLRPKKKAMIYYLSTITIGYLHSRQGSFKPENLRRLEVLFDTGCIASLNHHSLVGKLKQKDKPSNWSTKAGDFKTTMKCDFNFTLPVFHDNQNICWKAYVDSTDILASRFDKIISRIFLENLGIKFLFDTQMMEWDISSTPMQDLD